MITEIINAVAEAWVEITFTLVIMNMLVIGCVLAVDKPEPDQTWDEINDK